jgi:hypothetical protein
MADETAADTRWEMWRQDDNGSRFPVARFDTGAEADAGQRRYEALGHRQTYRVQQRTAEQGT